MKRLKKIAAITLILIVALAIGGFFYIDYWLGNLAADLDSFEKQQEQSETVEAGSAANDNVEENNKPDPAAEKSKDEANDTGGNAIAQEKPGTDEQSSDLSKVDKSVSEIKAANSQVGNAVEKQLDKSVDKKDLLQAAMIIVKKLDGNDISFMFSFSNGDYTSEDLIEARKVLLSKLSAEDISTLRALGQKYGKKLDILDPDVEIK